MRTEGTREEDWHSSNEGPKEAEVAGVKEEAIQAEAKEAAPTRATQELEAMLRARRAGEAPRGRTAQERATVTTVVKMDTGQESVLT